MVRTLFFLLSFQKDLYSFRPIRLFSSSKVVKILYLKLSAKAFAPSGPITFCHSSRDELRTLAHFKTSAIAFAPLSTPIPWCGWPVGSALAPPGSEISGAFSS